MHLVNMLCHNQFGLAQLVWATLISVIWPSRFYHSKLGRKHTLFVSWERRTIGGAKHSSRSKSSSGGGGGSRQAGSWRANVKGHIGTSNYNIKYRVGMLDYID
jgi:hypothetical protein